MAIFDHNLEMNMRTCAKQITEKQLWNMQNTNQTESNTSGPLNTEGSFMSFQMYNDGVEPT